jgi:hypothetical protein
LRKRYGQSIIEFPYVGSQQVRAPSFRPVWQQTADSSILKCIFDGRYDPRMRAQESLIILDA